MEKKNKVLKILIFLIIFCIATAPIMQSAQLIETVNPIETHKKVWDDGSWEDSTTVEVGDTIRFKLSVNYSQSYCGSYVTDIIVRDILPSVLHYDLQSVVITYGIPTDLDYYVIHDAGQSSIQGNSIYWNLTETYGIELYKEIPADPTERVSVVTIQFNCTILTSIFSNPTVTNQLSVNAIEHCCGIPLYGEDDAVVVIEPGSAIAVSKFVKDDCCWVKSVSVGVGDDVFFKVLVENVGGVDLTNVVVGDDLPWFLVYNDDANVTPSVVSDHYVEWVFSVLEPGEVVEIRYSAEAVSVDCGFNDVVVSSCQGVGGSDLVEVCVTGMIVEKVVWDPVHQQWVDELISSLGESARFKITISYYGNGSYNLYDIRVRDILPECLDFDHSVSPQETSISNDGQIIWWNLSISIESGEHVDIIFDTTIVETSGCGPCVNIGNVTARECSGLILYGEDDATVIADCPLCADANGPYSADLHEQILILGSAEGGTSPYDYYWDLDNDGYFDDARGSTVSAVWHSSGTFMIHLKVIDDNGQSDIDDTSVTIYSPPNHAPDAPSKPSGPTNGETGIRYSYVTSAIDDDDDTIRFGWDWNNDDVVDEWTGFVDSGSQVTTGHSWDSSGTYSVQVKAEDINGAQSDFSASISVVISGNDAPEKPSLSGPTSGKAGQSYTYYVYTNDPEDEEVYYKIDWDDGTTSTWHGPFSSGETIQLSHVWQNQGSYSIKVLAKDEHGAESEWSDPIPIQMPHSKYSRILSILMNLVDQYPFLEHMMNVFRLL